MSLYKCKGLKELVFVVIVLWRKGKKPEKVLKDYEKKEPLKHCPPPHMTDHMYMESSDVLYSLYFKNQLMVGPVRGKCLRLGIVTTS